MSNMRIGLWRAIKTALLAAFLAPIGFLIFLSGGRVLDVRVGIDEHSVVLTVISVICWIAIALVMFKAFFGSWQSSRSLKFALLLFFYWNPDILRRTVTYPRKCF